MGLRLCCRSRAGALRVDGTFSAAQLRPHERKGSAKRVCIQVCHVLCCASLWCSLRLPGVGLCMGPGRAFYCLGVAKSAPVDVPMHELACERTAARAALVSPGL